MSIKHLTKGVVLIKCLNRGLLPLEIVLGRSYAPDFLSRKMLMKDSSFEVRTEK